MSREFYYLEGNEQKGPLSIPQFKIVGLSPDSLVFTEGFDNWKPAKEVEDLKILFVNKPGPAKPLVTESSTPAEKIPIEIITGFIEPYLSYIDSGKLFRKPFSWLYILHAAGNVILPFYVIYKVIDSRVFKYASEYGDGAAKYVFAFLLIWLVLCVACWFGFQIWWNRKDKVQSTSEEGSEFPVTPVIAHYFQTSGEWFGTFIAIVGFGFSLIASIFLGSESGYLSSAMGLPFDQGFLGVVLFPLLGFAIIVLTRYFAELFRCFASIANNTKKQEK